MCQWCHQLTLNTDAWTADFKTAVKQLRKLAASMPNSPPVVCPTPGCGGRRTNGVCDRGCNATRNGTARRNTTWQSSPLYRTARWQKRAKAQLQTEPLCRECQKQGIVTVATVADHIEPWDGDEERFWDGELQSMCSTCHGRKSAGERRNNARSL